MNLKPGAPGSDRRGMRFSAAHAPDPEPSALLALRLSLNAPVVAIEDLPVGPARAAIALHRAEGDAVRLTVAVSLLRTGQVLFFAPDGELSGPDGSCPDLDAAIAFAEAMGFLFDEDEVQARGDAGPREAARLWYDLVGGPAVQEGGSEDAAPGHGAGPLPLTKFRPWAAEVASDAAPSADRAEGGPEGESAGEDWGVTSRTGTISDREGWREAW